MNKHKIAFTLLLILFGFSLSFSNKLQAQKTEKEDRLRQKTEVLEDILQKLLLNSSKKGLNYVFYGDKRVETRITDKGILFTVNQDRRLEDIEVNTIRSIDVNKGTNGAGTIRVDVKGKELDEMDSKTTQKALKDYQPAIVDFFADYAMLLTDLEDSDRVNILLKSSNSPFVFRVRESENAFGFRNEYVQGNSDQQNQLSASVQMNDVRKLMQGKIKREDFENYVQFEITEPEKTPVDVDIFTNVLEGLYTIRNTKNYFTTEPISYSNLASLGYLFKIKLYSSYRNNDQYEIVAKRDKKLFSQQEKDQFVLDSYNSWREECIQYIMDYGMTLKSLEKDRSVQFEITLPNCDTFDDKMPDMLRLQFSSSLFEEYRQGKLKTSDLNKRIKVEEIEK